MVENGTFKGYANCDKVELKDPLSYLEEECDYIIPAATEKSINKVNAGNL